MCVCVCGRLNDERYASSGVCEGADPVYTTCYADVNSQGRSITLKENADSLDELYMDDDIESVQQTGLYVIKN